MADAREAHRLGPHVVGTRVVVRRVLPGETGPSGGPALTDVLGVCLRWSEGECVVQPESGPTVTIPVELIVAGKPVPPRPSVRHRVSAHEVERHGFVLWPEMTTEPLGDWVLRAAPPVDGRRRRRANSVLAMGDPGVPLAEASARVIDHYTARDRDPVAMVELGSTVEAALRELGWRSHEVAPTHAQLASLARAARTARALGWSVPDVEPVGDQTRVLLDLGPARGRAAVEGDWLGMHGVEVDPDHRRQGLATSVVAGLLAWGGERGALTAWLHVESDNPGALGLYERLGFRTHHTCRYLRHDG